MNQEPWEPKTWQDWYYANLVMREFYKWKQARDSEHFCKTISIVKYSFLASLVLLLSLDIFEVIHLPLWLVIIFLLLIVTIMVANFVFYLKRWIYLEKHKTEYPPDFYKVFKRNSVAQTICSGIVLLFFIRPFCL